MDWGPEQQASFQKAKIPIKRIKALGISQAELPFELDVSVTADSMGWAIAKTGESASRILVPALEGAETR